MESNQAVSIEMFVQIFDTIIIDNKNDQRFSIKFEGSLIWIWINFISFSLGALRYFIINTRAYVYLIY